VFRSIVSSGFAAAQVAHKASSTCKKSPVYSFRLAKTFISWPHKYNSKHNFAAFLLFQGMDRRMSSPVTGVKAILWPLSVFGINSH
jgi:hypothetical protein